jgi:hypothetical protein
MLLLRQIKYGRVNISDIPTSFIRMDLREIVWESVEWIQLAQDRDSCKYDEEPEGSAATELVILLDKHFK